MIPHPDLTSRVWQRISRPPSHAEVWFLYQDPHLFQDACRFIVAEWLGQCDYIAMVNDAAAPLAVGIVWEARSKGEPVSGLLLANLPTMVRNTPDAVPRTLAGKRICLVDEAISTGQHAQIALKTLENEGAIVPLLVVVLDNTAEPNREAYNELLAHSSLKVCALCHPAADPVGATVPGSPPTTDRTPTTNAPPSRTPHASPL